MTSGPYEISPPEAGNTRRGQLMLGGEPDDQISMDDRPCARRRNQAAIGRTRKRRDCAFNFTCLTRADRGQLQSERRCSCLDCAELASSGRNIGIANDGDPRHSWRNLLEQLQPFCAQTVFKTDKACDVTTWPRQAIDEASADRIDNVREHNWHSARRFQ